jgi:hypothetical protein
MSLWLSIGYCNLVILKVYISNTQGSTKMYKLNTISIQSYKGDSPPLASPASWLQGGGGGLYMVDLSDLDFAHGKAFQQQLKASFDVSVSPISSSSVFLLVASFGCSAIRIDSDSVSLMIQSCLGGVASDSNVVCLNDWCFRFSVSCKKVGLMIHHLKSFVGKHFIIHFTFWRDGSGLHP